MNSDEKENDGRVQKADYYSQHLKKIVPGSLETTTQSFRMERDRMSAARRVYAEYRPSGQPRRARGQVVA